VVIEPPVMIETSAVIEVAACPAEIRTSHGTAETLPTHTCATKSTNDAATAFAHMSATESASHKATTSESAYVAEAAETASHMTAALNLIYVAHSERMPDIPAEDRRLFSSVDTGFIGQNVYLFCASEGLATVFRGSVDYKKLAQTMQLAEEQFITFAQTVGYPKV
jgi:nitroreductase